MSFLRCPLVPRRGILWQSEHPNHTNTIQCAIWKVKVVVTSNNNTFLGIWSVSHPAYGARFRRRHTKVKINFYFFHLHCHRAGSSGWADGKGFHPLMRAKKAASALTVMKLSECQHQSFGTFPRGTGRTPLSRPEGWSNLMWLRCFDSVIRKIILRDTTFPWLEVGEFHFCKLFSIWYGYSKNVCSYFKLKLHILCGTELTTLFWRSVEFIFLFLFVCHSSSGNLIFSPLICRPSKREATIPPNKYASFGSLAPSCWG